MKTKRTLAAAWARRAKLHAEGAKLHADGDLVWVKAWIDVHGKDSVVEWTKPKGDR